MSGPLVAPSEHHQHEKRHQAIELEGHMRPAIEVLVGHQHQRPQARAKEHGRCNTQARAMEMVGDGDNTQSRQPPPT